MALGAKLNVTFQRRFLAFWNSLDPHNGNPFGLKYFSDFLEFVDTLQCLHTCNQTFWQYFDIENLPYSKQHSAVVVLGQKAPFRIDKVTKFHEI